MQGLQLVKIPQLITHVEKHYGDQWTWSDMKSFVVEHYLNSELPDDKEHKNLPFKTTVSGSTVISHHHSFPKVELTAGLLEEERETIAYDPVKPIKDRAINIWTPPKNS